MRRLSLAYFIDIPELTLSEIQYTKTPSQCGYENPRTFFLGWPNTLARENMEVFSNLSQYKDVMSEVVR